MFKDFGISEADWNSTPQSVKTAIIALQHQARLVEIHFTAYDKKLAALAAKDAEIESLRTEVAALRERLGQNSNNSSRPPSSDPPTASRQSRRESSGKKQGAQAGHQGIGRAKTSIITTDRYLGYSWLATQRRQVCWAHLKRDFQAMAERSGESKEIGEALLGQTKEVFRLWHEVKDGDLSRRKFQRLIAAVQQRVKKLLDADSDCRSSKTRGTCRQIRTVEGALWTFARVRGVEPTNNATERALRRAVLWRRKSFGTQSGTAAGSLNEYFRSSLRSSNKGAR